VGRDPFAGRAELAPNRAASAEFQFGHFSFEHLRKLGRHKVVASTSIGGLTLTSPPVEFEVIDVANRDVLTNHTVVLEGLQLLRPPNERDRVVVRQVKAGGRVLLICQHYTWPKYGGGLEYTFRLAELPCECEMAVEGGYGAGKPLTVVYKTSPTAQPSRIVINPINGKGWTDEDEEALQERLKNSKP
jgi:hypothetical protein